MSEINETIEQRLRALRKLSRQQKSREWYHDRIDELEIFLSAAEELFREAPLHHYGKAYSEWKKKCGLYEKARAKGITL